MSYPVPVTGLVFLTCNKQKEGIAVCTTVGHNNQEMQQMMTVSVVSENRLNLNTINE